MPRFKYRDSKGNVWDSEYEFRVFDALRKAGAPVRRLEGKQGDSIVYSERKQSTRCLDCGSDQCFQTRRYTADFIVDPTGTHKSGELEEGSGLPEGAYLIEAKGYFRQDKRKLFRDLTRFRPDLDIRLVVQRELKVGKGTILTWAEKYAKVPAHKWDNKKDDISDVVPKEWITW